MRRVKLLSNLSAAFVATVAIANISPVQAEETLKLIIATEGANPPFNYIKPDGTLAGFDVEIAGALCEQMQADCKIIAQEWDGAIPSLQAGKFDAFIAMMSITEERKKQIDFSDKYYNAPPAIVVTKGSDIKGVTAADLAGKTVGVQIATTHANYADEVFTQSEVSIYPSAEEYRLDLINGRLDAVNDDSVTLIEWLKTEDGACCELLGTFPPTVSIHGEGVGVAIKKDRPELVEKFNLAIKNMRESGQYKEINDRYFDFDAYGESN